MANKTESEKLDHIPEHMRSFRYTGSIRPHYPLSPTRAIPSHIEKPDYADHPQGFSMCESVKERSAKILSKEEIEGVRKACRLSREVLDIVASHIRPGITTDELDAICHQACIDRDSYPSPLNYFGFPKSICISVNEVVCHGIPDQRPLQEGDIINLDVSLYHGGFHGDLNMTYPVGKIDQESHDLIETTKKATEAAIAICKPGVPYRDIGNKIEEYVKPKGYGIVRRYTGHGIDRLFHGPPNIVHYGGSKTPGRMEAGQIFTIEPMINLGSSNVEHWNDDWTAVTVDGRRSAQFEETILITETGAEILTRIAPSSANKKKKKKKKATKADGSAPIDADDAPENEETPTIEMAEGISRLDV
ncbi:methionine aminopeptidase, type I [Cryptococcus depauperatus]|nr:methionine aminopeptidase, type I [Cryptococcus depauperatus CBS 7855]